MSDLFDALTDMKQDVLDGFSIEDAAQTAAEEYALNPALLTRKFIESYHSVEAVRALQQSTGVAAAAQSLEARVQSAVTRACVRYGVDVARTKVHTIRGVEYRIICHLVHARVRPYVGVSLVDAQTYRLAA